MSDTFEQTTSAQQSKAITHGERSKYKVAARVPLPNVVVRNVAHLGSGSGKRLQYFVHWRGYPDSAAEWLPAVNLSNAPDKVPEFWEFKGQPCPHALSVVSHISEGFASPS
jgi:hypothetical protein